MSELWRIVLTAIFTIVGGTIVYAGGHFLVALFVEPIHRLRSLIGEIADSLVFYADIYSNPGYCQKEIMDEASETLRRQASQLRARAHSILGYQFWVFIKLVPQTTNIQESSAELIGLSNSVHRSEPNLGIQNYRRREKIEALLGIRESTKRKENQSINSRMLSHGVLLFFFSLILLAVQPRTLVLFGFEIFTFPIWFYTALGIIALTVSVSFMIAIFWKWLAVRLENFLEVRPPSHWQYSIQYLYWVVFWLVYTVGWLKGLSSIPAQGSTFEIAFWFGFVWFLIIPIAWFRVLLQQRK